jgi:hypothetical protein
MQTCFFHSTNVWNLPDWHLANEFEDLLQLWLYVGLAVWFIDVRADFSYHSVWTDSSTASQLRGTVYSHPNGVGKLLSTFVVVQVILLQKICDIHVYLI